MKTKQNKILYQDNIKTIFLIESPKYGNKEIIIDTEDWERIKVFRWHVYYSRSNFYVISTFYKNNNSTIIKLHRYIMNNLNKKIGIDHINQNTFDNRKQNLRECTQSENSMNRGKNKNNTSGYKGVIWRKDCKKWQCRIGVNNKRICLGFFTNPRDAAFFYNLHAIKYHGEFACLNQLQENANAN